MKNIGVSGSAPVSFTNVLYTFELEFAMVVPVASACCSWLMGSPDRVPGRELMHWQRRVAALFVVLGLAGCAQETTGQAGAPYAPYSPENNGNMHDSGGGGGAGGGM